MTSFASWHVPSELASMLATAAPGKVACVAGGATTTYGQLRACADEWSHALGALRPGDRVVLALPPGPVFIAALLGAWQRDLAIVQPRPGDDVRRAAHVTDARLILAPTSLDGFATLTPDDVAAGRRATPVDVASPACPGVALLMRSSGTTSADQRFVVLSATNLLTVLTSHRGPLGLTGRTVLSVLPWAHVFGLVIELLSSLLAGATVVRAPGPGCPPRTLIGMARRHEVTHAFLVPLQVSRIAATEEGRAWLHELRGGVVGGARIDASVASTLAGTRLRVGYGLTEAAPGVTLGRPGAFRAGGIGHPLGCDLRTGQDGVLEVRGSNVCVGFWTENGPHTEDPTRWLRTGDIGSRQHDGAWRYDGRVDHRFKLANGRMLDAPTLEAELGTALRTVAVLLPAGQSARLLVETDELTTADDDRIRAVLGRMPVEVEAHRVLPRTRKGDIDRRALAAAPEPGRAAA